MGWCFQRPKDNVENASLPGLWSSSADRTWRTWLYKPNRFNTAHMCAKGRGVSHMWKRLKYSTTLLPWRHMGEVSFAHMLPHRLLCGSASLLLTVPQWNITRHEHRLWSCRHRHANQGFSCSVENDEYIYTYILLCVGSCGKARRSESAFRKRPILSPVPCRFLSSLLLDDICICLYFSCVSINSWLQHVASV